MPLCSSHLPPRWSARWSARRLVCLAACLLLCAAPARAERLAAADEPPFAAFYKQLAVKILRGNTAGTQFIGSGFTWVVEGRAFAVTNFHVAQKGLGAEPAPGGLYVGFAGPMQWQPASHMLGVSEADLAVLETAAQAPVADNPYTLGVATLGETVYSISYDQGAFQQAAPVVYQGSVAAITMVHYPTSVLAIKPPYPPDAVPAYVIDGSNCIYGASGGMLLNSRGELVAYNTGTIGNGLCIAVAIDAVTRALARWPRAGR